MDEIINKKLATLVTKSDQSRNLRAEEDLDNAKLGQGQKNKSMVKMKEEDSLKQKVMRIATTNYQSLGTFIRLIDYMVVQT